MSVISLAFVVFITITFLVYFCVPSKLQPYVLLIASLFFYSTFDLIYFFYIGFTCITTFLLALCIDRDQTIRNKKIFLFLSVFINIGLLFVVKFLGYSISLLTVFLDIPAIKVSLPMAVGISFYTMSGVSYCVDVYRAKYKPEKNIFKYLLYMTYFPTIMQGPISRFDQLGNQLFSSHSFDFMRMKSGLSLILWGMFKKMVIADRAALLVNQVFNNFQQYYGFQIVIAILFYSVQLYTDFSGITDISRGVSEVLGIELINNFDHPYFSSSIKEFWRKWHISLSSWFRDYIYFPLGGNRKGKVRQYINIFVVFFASGLWHGVGINYILWGLLQAIFQTVEDLSANCRSKVYAFFNADENLFCYRFIKIAFTFMLVNFSWFIFRANGILAFWQMFKSLFVLNFEIFFDGSLFLLGLDLPDFIVLMISIVILFVVSYLQRKYSLRKEIEKQAFWFRYIIYIVAIIIILVFGMYGPGYSQSQFLYMQF